MDNQLIALIRGSLDKERAAYIEGIKDIVGACVVHVTGHSRVSLPSAGLDYYERLNRYRADLTEGAWADLVGEESRMVFAALNGKLPIHTHTYPMHPQGPDAESVKR